MVATNFSGTLVLVIASVLAATSSACGNVEISSRPPQATTSAKSPSIKAGTAEPATDAAWDHLKQTLTGRFRATVAENRTIVASYRVISKGSALVETFTTASGNETATVFHRDGGRLMLTHYCAQGNQARLRAVEATTTRVVFEFEAVTNASSDQSVMHRLVFTFRPDGFDQESVYEASDGTSEATTLHFVRE